MSTIIGSARIDERGKISGGAAGDSKQTSTPDYRGEVSMQSFYVHKQGWYILRPKSDSIAQGIANAMVTACNNKNLGYDQNQRLGVITHGVGSTVRTECDCSALIRACIIAAAKVDVGNFTTANEASVLTKSGLFHSAVKFVSESKTPLYTGDVLVTCTRGHTVVVTSGKSRIQPAPAPAPASNGSYYAKYTGPSGSITVALAAVGEKDTSMTNRKKIAAANGINNYSGTSDQNIKMLNLLKSGALKKATGSSSSGTTSNKYPKYTGTSTSIVTALAAVGEKDTSMTHRRKIAAANGFTAYSGTQSQNTKLVNLLKAGNLIRA